MSERETDERDLRILDDYLSGTFQKDITKKYGVSKRHVERLIKAWKDAA